MKHLVVHCRTQNEIGLLSEFLEERPGCKWIRIYRRSEEYRREGSLKVVVGVPDEQTEFQLNLQFKVLQRCKV